MFVFCKQKTAYEMRISDWSSDVCSSDLRVDLHAQRQQVGEVAHQALDFRRVAPAHRGADYHVTLAGKVGEQQRIRAEQGHEQGHVHVAAAGMQRGGQVSREDRKSTPSELQSLMRISYAVFCLKKKKTKTTQLAQNHATQTD